VENEVVKPITLGKCECCRKRKAEWQCVNLPGRGVKDLCDVCFGQLRRIYQKHPATLKSGKRSSDETTQLENAVYDWLQAKLPKRPKTTDPVLAEAEAILNAALANV
jgi:hypothetical protein